MDDKLLTYLCFSAYKAFNLSLQGTESSHRSFEFFKNIQPGHLVMEVSTIWMRKHDPIRIGFLETVTRESIYSDGEWSGIKTEGEECPTEMVYYIRALSDGEQKRWTNCDFVRVIDDPDWMRISVC